jgi:hypothetical protein
MKTLVRLGRKIRRFRALPDFTRRWFIPACLLLVCSRLLILLLSFKRLAPCLGSLHRDGAVIPLLGVRQEIRAAQLRDVLQLAARHTPWTSNCLPQAVAARMLLGLHGIPLALCLGIRPDRADKSMSAHAWVAAGRVAVCGGNGFGDFRVVACFVDFRAAGARRAGGGDG